MNTNYINFKRKRDLGDVFNDTFAFLRQNFKPIFSLLVKTSGVAFIIMLATTAYYNHTSLNITGGNVFVGMQDASEAAIITMLISLVIMLLALLVFYAQLFGTTLFYIKSYTENQGVVDLDYVIQQTRDKTGSLIGLSLSSGFLVFLGFLFCVIPGFYLYVPLSLVFAIMVFENKSIGECIEYSFKLVKGEWWTTFATLFVIAILISIIGGVFSVPAIIYAMVKTVSSASAGSLSDPTVAFDWVFVTLTTISSAIQYILYIITAVSTAFIYFNLNELKNFTGAFEQIDSLGKNE
ncbi:hypothetical protein [Aquimarina rhabdastrellae]